MKNELSCKATQTLSPSMNPVPGTPGPGWGGGGWRGLPPGTELWAPAGDGQLRAIRREDRRQPFLKVLLFKILFGVAKGSHDPAHRPLLRLPALRPELWHIFYSHFQIAGHSQIRFCFFFCCLFVFSRKLPRRAGGRKRCDCLHTKSSVETQRG